MVEQVAEQSEASIALVESRAPIAVTEPVEAPPVNLKAPELYINRGTESSAVQCPGCWSRHWMKVIRCWSG